MRERERQTHSIILPERTNGYGSLFGERMDGRMDGWKDGWDGMEWLEEDYWWCK